MVSFTSAAGLRMTVDLETLSGPVYLDGDQSTVQTNAGRSRVQRIAALAHEMGDVFAILLWMVILLHPFLLIALSFHWGLL